MEPDVITPEELADELELSGKAVRAYIRSQIGRLTGDETRWQLNRLEAAGIRCHFGKHA